MIIVLRETSRIIFGKYCITQTSQLCTHYLGSVKCKIRSAVGTASQKSAPHAMAKKENTSDFGNSVDLASVLEEKAEEQNRASVSIIGEILFR